jgi:hypothetical protein
MEAETQTVEEQVNTIEPSDLITPMDSGNFARFDLFISFIQRNPQNHLPHQQSHLGQLCRTAWLQLQI